MNLTGYRGKAVLVTFLYTHCVDVCPLIAANLGVVLDDLGRGAGRVQVIAVSVDPRRDMPRAVAAFLKLHQMTGRMKYLIGSRQQLAPVWHAWHVSAIRDPTNGQLVLHSAVVFGVSATGKLMIVYPASFVPSELVHDVPGLLNN